MILGTDLIHPSNYKNVSDPKNRSTFNCHKNVHYVKFITIF